jgi:3alpha(or 20beta)-hydroxysteroid dehydrogenase
VRNRVCLITGGTSGMGLAAAEAFIAAGAKVVVTGRNVERGEAAAAGLREKGGDAAYLEQDTTYPDDWQRVVAAVVDLHGGIHTWVNNSGVYLNRPFIETTLEDWDRLFAVNTRGVYIGLKTVLPVMRETAKDGPTGSIVLVSSDASIRAFTGQTIYNASKAGVDLLTKGLGREFADLGYNIRVNSVNPTLTVTGMTEVLFSEWIADGIFGNRDEIMESLAAPIGRVGEADDVGKLIYFLASDDAAFITGINVLIDGGSAIADGLLYEPKED